MACAAPNAGNIERPQRLDRQPIQRNANGTLSTDSRWRKRAATRPVSPTVADYPVHVTSNDDRSALIMGTSSSATDTATLDPADWEAFRELAHRIVDDMIAHLATLRDQPVWQPMPPSVRDALREPLPLDGQGDTEVYREFAERVLPYPNGNAHPRFFGWVQGNGTPFGMMAEMLAAGMNPHMAGFDQAPTLVEQQVVRWLIELMGYPSLASGVLTGGGTIANILGLAVARNADSRYDVRAAGVCQVDQPLCVYASAETHGWVDKGVELLGLGRASLRRVACGDDYRMSVRAVRDAIAADRAAGRRPMCIVATAGTVNTAATDDLVALSRLARDEDVWLHVDGAFGALARWSDRLAPIVAGIDEADSVAFDLHKWMYQPFTVACLLVRRGEAHRRAFALSASYLAPAERGVMAGGLPFADLGIDLTRPFHALKVWMAFKAHGVRLITRLIERNVEQAQMLGRIVHETPELELLAPIPLNIVCLRYVPTGGSDDATLNRLNQELLLRLQESGIAMPSSTILRGRLAIRCCMVNHRTQPQDVRTLVDAILAIGRELAHESSGG